LAIRSDAHEPMYLFIYNLNILELSFYTVQKFYFLIRRKAYFEEYFIERYYII